MTEKFLPPINVLLDLAKFDERIMIPPKYFEDNIFNQYFLSSIIFLPSISINTGRLPRIIMSSSDKKSTI